MHLDDFLSFFHFYGTKFIIPRKLKILIKMLAKLISVYIPMVIENIANFNASIYPNKSKIKQKKNLPRSKKIAYKVK